MKLTKSKLKQIIKEELSKALYTENDNNITWVKRRVWERAKDLPNVAWSEPEDIQLLQQAAGNEYTVIDPMDRMELQRVSDQGTAEELLPSRVVKNPDGSKQIWFKDTQPYARYGYVIV